MKNFVSENLKDGHLYIVQVVQSFEFAPFVSHSAHDRAYKQCAFPIRWNFENGACFFCCILRAVWCDNIRACYAYVCMGMGMRQLKNRQVCICHQYHRSIVVVVFAVAAAVAAFLPSFLDIFLERIWLYFG